MVPIDREWKDDEKSGVVCLFLLFGSQVMAKNVPKMDVFVLFSADISKLYDSIWPFTIGSLQRSL